MKWIVKMILFVLLFVTLISTVLMLLWNWLLPEIFGLPEISFWQAFGLLLLSKIIFGLPKGHKGHAAKWRPQFVSKWQNVSPEEKKQWKQKFAEKWGCHMDKEEDNELRQA